MKKKRSKKEQVIFKCNDFTPFGGLKFPNVTIEGYSGGKYCIVFFEKGIINEINFSEKSLDDDPVWAYILAKFKQHQI